MRRLNKGPEPQVLVDRGAEWTEAYVASPGTTTEKWRHPTIKASLDAETDSKCAYCESKMSDITYPHVEHMIPKSARRDLAHVWTNLTWACPVCNVEKGEFYHPTEGVLNPYADDIEDELHFLGDFVGWQLGSVRGEVTVRTLELNRLDLVEARINRLLKVRDMLERWHAAQEPLKGTLAAAIRRDARRGEFTASVATYLQHIGFPIADGLSDQ